jgi:hypothetical protein
MRLLLRVIDQKCRNNSAVPIDKLYAEDLKSSGQVTFDKMLAQNPSFNSVVKLFLMRQLILTHRFMV